MPTIGHAYLSNKEIDIITNLFRFRSGTALQLTYILEPALVETDSALNTAQTGYTGRVKYIAKILNGLTKKGLVAIFKVIHTPKYVYYLTQDGLNTAYTILEIEEHSAMIAGGWEGDYGYFDYSLYKPTQDRFAHHDLTIHFQILMMHYAGVYQYKYDWIDNRYASTEFAVKSGKTTKRFFRPDGEFKIIRPGHQDHYWLEVDMSTERGEKLADKFETYRQYLDYVTEGIKFDEANDTPNSIMFHSAASYIQKRWTSVLVAFISRMGEYASLVNLRLTNNTTLNEAVSAEINKYQLLDKLKSNLKNYLLQESGFKGVLNQNGKNTFVKLLPEDEVILGNWSPNLIIVENSDLTNQVLLFENYDGYESIGLARTIDFYKKFKTLTIGKSDKITDVIPVLCYYDNKVNELPFKGTLLEKETRNIFSKLIFHDVKNNLWFDGQTNQPILNNPLMYRSH